jgi:tetratricopeptide (TPR) repeat protein
MFASYGYIMYWMKFIFPFELSAFYPYPTFGEQKQLPFIYYASPLIAITITFLPFFYILKRKKKEWLKSYVFGIGFFIATIILVLQFISVGAAIMADRYSYIPFIGSIFLLLYLIEQSNLFKNKKNYFIVGITALSVIFSIQCYKMVETWTNSETLWSNVIELFPYRIEQNGNVVKIIENGVEVAYKNRGNYYRENGRMDLAFEDYEVLVRARVNDPLVYSNMGNMYAMENKFDKSIEMYKLALERDKKIFDVYLNRGITFGKMGKHEEAIKDYHSALEIRKNDLQTSILMCHEYLNAQQFDEVINNVEPIIKNQPTNFEGYFLRGTANVNKGNFNPAIADLNKSIDLNPNYPYSWYNSSIAYNAVGDKKNALDRALKAKSLGMNINENYLMGLR